MCIIHSVPTTYSQIIFHHYIVGPLHLPLPHPLQLKILNKYSFLSFINSGRKDRLKIIWHRDFCILSLHSLTNFCSTHRSLNIAEKKITKGHTYYPFATTTLYQVQHHHVLKDLQGNSSFFHFFSLLIYNRTLKKIL